MKLCRQTSNSPFPQGIDWKPEFAIGLSTESFRQSRLPIMFTWWTCSKEKGVGWHGVFTPLGGVLVRRFWGYKLGRQEGQG